MVPIWLVNASKLEEATSTAALLVEPASCRKSGVVETPSVCNSLTYFQIPQVYRSAWVHSMATFSFLQGATGVLQIAGNFSGIPYAGAVATIVAGIVETTRQIQVHRVSAVVTSRFS
jgi:hypothetical protein